MTILQLWIALIVRLAPLAPIVLIVYLVVRVRKAITSDVSTTDADSGNQPNANRNSIKNQNVRSSSASNTNYYKTGSFAHNHVRRRGTKNK